MEGICTLFRVGWLSRFLLCLLYLAALLLRGSYMQIPSFSCSILLASQHPGHPLAITPLYLHIRKSINMGKVQHSMWLHFV